MGSHSRARLKISKSTVRQRAGGYRYFHPWNRYAAGIAASKSTMPAAVVGSMKSAAEANLLVG